MMKHTSFTTAPYTLLKNTSCSHIKRHTSVTYNLVLCNIRLIFHDFSLDFLLGSLKANSSPIKQSLLIKPFSSSSAGIMFVPTKYLNTFFCCTSYLFGNTSMLTSASTSSLKLLKHINNCSCLQCVSCQISFFNSFYLCRLDLLFHFFRI